MSDAPRHERLSLMRNRSSEKIAVKSQDLGKQISRKRVAQQILRQRNKRFAFAFCGVLLAFRPAQL
jgi:hypothetical protein